MTIGKNDYPYGRSGYDPYGFAAGQCASFVDWRCINDLRIGPQHSSTGLNGGQWGDYLRSKGYAVDGTPRVHDIVSLHPGVDGAGSYGHVALVLEVHNDGTVLVEDYNWNNQETYSQHSIKSAGAQFAHVAPVPGPAPPTPAPPAPQPAFWQVPFAGQIDERFQGTVDVNAANLRMGPGTNYPLAGGPLHLGARINFYAFVYGQPIWDNVGRDWDRRWFRIASGNYATPFDGRLIASALVNGNPPNSHP